MSLSPPLAYTNTQAHAQVTPGAGHFSRHDLNCCSKASSSRPLAAPPLHPSPAPLCCLPHILLRIKVTFLSLHPSTRALPRAVLTAAHSRRCQAEIILSVKLSNEARDTDAGEEQAHPGAVRVNLRLWRVMRSSGEESSGWNEKECLFLCHSLWSLFHLIFRDCRFNTKSLLSFNLLHVQFPFLVVTLWVNKKTGMWFLILCRAGYRFKGKQHWKQV